jgi:hypothetical protein
VLARMFGDMIAATISDIVRLIDEPWDGLRAFGVRGVGV